jgi:hypothetical protein
MDKKELDKVTKVEMDYELRDVQYLLNHLVLQHGEHLSKRWVTRRNFQSIIFLFLLILNWLQTPISFTKHRGLLQTGPILRF